MKPPENGRLKRLIFGGCYKLSLYFHANIELNN
ncbi:hypothetical protein YPC_4485 [Yersinia pestis biovar Medievalis str. Harbin 35]|nr:hypothetical protein YPC_4485 [Yersinia pestis biovar Medievalis str. Harbin 35]EEO74522.1 hypothetical protein YP516_4121 [Yersinia pestis Nepal516]EEO83153.1 hypothetical protein YPF_0080 [Yersinia pestis biovar Orientalis str. India 195]EEO86091.1 hypothetical protein YPH_1994 [Yersinia pestis biovar Orientalis str. PEXU2]EEO92517.1 hypothetical protein YPS_0333 [Yersinia pestis Pestoides A]